MKLIIKSVDGIIEKELDVNASAPLLRQLEAAWVSMHSACHAGICGACICNIESGWENLDTSFFNEPWFPLAPDEIMTCIWGICQSEWTAVLKKIY